MTSRDHYQKAFEAYLRERRIPYVSVDEARRALLPEGGPLRVGCGVEGSATLKSFDFVVYGEGSNLLVEVKGRKVARRRPARAGTASVASRVRVASEVELRGPARSRLESWVTRDDVESLGTWERLFGGGFTAVFAFVYWCEELPPGALFEEYVERDGRQYAIRCVARGEYESAMKVRSPRWRTVHLAGADFERLSRPLTSGR